MSTTSALYLVHQPWEVLSSVPSLIDKEGMGNMPKYGPARGHLTSIEGP
jgi:hypothetical protein